MNTNPGTSAVASIEAVPVPVLSSADVDEVTLGRQTFNDSDKDNYFEG
ncbi:hypothetical protein ACVNF4_32490 [Streptomyces sp. S6]